MDIVELAQVVTATLTPALPYLLRIGERAAEETGKRIAVEASEWVTELWGKLRPKVENRPAALEAAQEVAVSPEDADAQAALRLQLRKLFADDHVFANEIGQCWNQNNANGITMEGEIERSFAIGGNVTDSAIVIGDGNIIGKNNKTS